MNNEVVAILINAQVFNELAQYMSNKPYAEVKGFFDAFQQSAGLTQEMVDKLNEKEEAPE